jgi:hypothetical protein
MKNARRLRDALLLAFRPARWSIFGYRFVPWLLFSAGVGSAVYGGFYHRIAVSEEHAETRREEQITITVPDEQAPPGGPAGMPPFSATDAFGQPTEPLRPAFKTVQATKTVTVPAWTSIAEESELTVNRAVTVAAIIRGPQGQVLRTSTVASVGEAGGPAFCPS